MAAIAFDPLEYTHQLEASGVPREQAEVHAKAMTAMFLHNFDALVTKDYLDSRFDAFETRIVGEMNRRFAEFEASMDKRFAEFEARIDKRFGVVDSRFAEMESSIDKRFDAMDRRFGDVESRFAEAEANMELRFSEVEASMEQRFSEVEASMDKRFAQVDVRFERMEGRFNLLYWMQGITLVCVVIPVVHRLLG